MPAPKSPHSVWHHATVTRARRERQNGHPGAVVWFTGLSGSGKSTLAHAVEEQLHARGCRTFVCDGEVFCDCPLTVCEQRDIKGLYRRARNNQIADFTGISSPYETPQHPDLTVQTGARSVAECAREVLAMLESRGIAPRGGARNEKV